MLGGEAVAKEPIRLRMLYEIEAIRELVCIGQPAFVVHEVRGARA